MHMARFLELALDFKPAKPPRDPRDQPRVQAASAVANCSLHEDRAPRLSPHNPGWMTILLLPIIVLVDVSSYVHSLHEILPRWGQKRAYYMPMVECHRRMKQQYKIYQIGNTNDLGSVSQSQRTQC